MSITDGWDLLFLLLDLLLVAGATLRLTRLVLTDDLGKWLLRDPADRWAARWARVIHPGGSSDNWRTRLVSGLDCPFCVSFHVAWILIALTAGFRWIGDPWLDGWRGLLFALTVSWLTAHVGVRMGDAGYAEEEEDDG